MHGMNEALEAPQGLLAVLAVEWKGEPIMPLDPAVFLDLILNLSLLVSLTVVSGFIERRWPMGTRASAVFQGLLFGGTAVVGMLRPLNLGPGLIFDGRSVMISLCSLFFGPAAGVISVLMTMSLRIFMGGSGMKMGVLVILASFAIGLIARRRILADGEPPSIGALYLFGLAVHAAMLAMMSALPPDIRAGVFARMGPPVMLLYPVATVLAGKILSDLISSIRNLERVREAREGLSVTLQSIGDAVISTDLQGRITLMNRAAEAITGWSGSEAMGRSITEVLPLINEETREKVDDPTARVIKEGKVVGLANHTVLITKTGREVPIADSGAPIKARDGSVAGAVIVFRDQSEERLTKNIMEARLRLMAYAQEHSSADVLRQALDEVGRLVSSPVGFYHFVAEDQKTIYLQQWSSQTVEKFCRAEGRSLHYPIDKAGVWADCIREGRPLIHNDYASLPNRRGLPEGHVPIVREIVVPVRRRGSLVAVLGVGNKPDDYTQRDLDIVSYMADVTWEIVEAKRTQEALRESEERFRTTFYASPDAINITRLEDGLYVDTNEGFTVLTGYTREEVLGKTSLEIGIWHDPKDRERRVRDLKEKGYCQNLEAHFRKKDGTVGTGLMSAKLIKLNNVPHIVSITREITAIKQAEQERKRLEEQLVQAQKMESVGRLAGGIAHDFNNMLGVILGRTELALMTAEPGSSLHSDLLDIQKAAKRSSDLTRQLLGFARRQTAAPRVLDLNETIKSMLEMLRRLIGEDIDLGWIPGAGLWPVKMDPAQLDQILTNLIVNARDAIEDVGKITIETENVSLAKDYCRERPFFVPGRYVCMTVSDTGCGIAKDIMDRIFEPFFTTKDVGKGTGLGLATVYGIVKQNNGYINVYSELGRGTTFKVYLPVHEDTEAQVHSGVTEHAVQGGNETVLLVEDEPMLLEMGEKMLKRLGYNVLTAQGPSQALETVASYPDDIALIITDVVMPDMNGKELSERVLSLRPGIRCLFTSGYTANVIARHGVLEEGVLFIQKPFLLRDLALKVREALD
jgi:PAS domain S-box-containing protein